MLPCITMYVRVFGQINAMAMAFYINNLSLAKSIAVADSGYRYDNEINLKGEVYRELGDSGSYGYTIGTMGEFMLLARATKLAGVDMYSYANKTTGFGNLRNALAWMAPYCARGAECGQHLHHFSTPQAQAKCIGWPYPAVDYSPISECTLVYGLASLAYDNATYGAAAVSTPDDPYRFDS